MRGRQLLPLREPCTFLYRAGADTTRVLVSVTTTVIELGQKDAGEGRVYSAYTLHCSPSLKEFGAETQIGKESDGRN